MEVLVKEKKVSLMKNSSIQTGVIWKDTPISQLKTDKFLNKCQSIRKKIDSRTEYYKKMMDFGEGLMSKNPQYMIMCERLKTLKDDGKTGRSSS